jgi:hypothetical protein
LVWTGGHFVFRFIKGGMNLIDLLGILPYFVSLSLDMVTTTARFEPPMKKLNKEETMANVVIELEPWFSSCLTFLSWFPSH